MRFTKKLLQALFIVFITFIFLNIFSSPIAAEDTDVNGQPCIDSFTSFEGAGFSTVPAVECINESIKSVVVIFNDLNTLQGDTLGICSGHNDCFKEEGTDKIKYLKGIKEVTPPSISPSPSPSPAPSPEASITPTATDINVNSIAIEICGDHEDRVKSSECDGGDYFHGGNAYVFSIGIWNKEDEEYYPLSKAGFYVARSYPEVKLSPHTGLKPGASMVVNMSGGFRGGGDNRNNYQLNMRGPGMDSYQCGTIENANSSFSKQFDNLREGRYTLTIRDRTKEGASLTGNRFWSESCDKAGGFTFFSVSCEVKNEGGSCQGVDKDGIVINKDPKGEEYREFIKQLQILNGTTNGYIFPCGDGTKPSSGPGPCLELETAIGTIDVSTPMAFIKKIFQFVLVLASFGAVLLIIYAGFTYMASRGDKEKVQGARETLTSTVVGLLFIILSLVILEIIGVDILAIPGFER